MKMFFINIIISQGKYSDEGVETINDVCVRSENFQ